MRTFLIVLLLLPVAALAQPDIDMRVDLDGDGEEEVLRGGLLRLWAPSPGFDRFVVDVAFDAIVLRGEGFDGTLYIVDIDTTDSFLDIAIPETGPSGGQTVHFVRYVGRKLVEIGEVPVSYDWRDNAIDGSGVVTGNCRGKILHSWWYECGFQLTPYGKLERGSWNMIEMDTRVTLKIDFQVFVKRRSAEVSGTIHVGESATIMKTDDEDWCYIESESGVKGWFAVNGHRWIPSVRMAAPEVFDGLSYAN